LTVSRIGNISGVTARPAVITLIDQCVHGFWGRIITHVIAPIDISPDFLRPGIDGHAYGIAQTSGKEPAVRAIHIVYPDSSTMEVGLDADVTIGTNGYINVLIWTNEHCAGKMLSTFRQIGNDALDRASLQIVAQGHTCNTRSFTNVEITFIHDKAGRIVEIAGYRYWFA